MHGQQNIKLHLRVTSIRPCLQLIETNSNRQ